MATLASLLIASIALLHIYIMWFEMFAWETHGPKIFGNLSADMFPKTKAMAANQGLYNGFLATGLIAAD
jgi:putative membrane protein